MTNIQETNSNYLVSVVLPTYNRLDRLQRVLAALEKQTLGLDKFEVVVVSDGSEDGTNEYLHSLQSPLTVTPVLQKNQGVAAARNNGFRHASADMVMFIDDDVVPTPQLLAEHLAKHAEFEQDVIVVGPMLTPDDFDMVPWVQYEQAMLVKQYDAMLAGKWEPTARQFYTGNTSLARHILVESGGFDQNFRRAEDVELAYRLAAKGYKFIFHYDAVGYHYAHRSFESWLNTPYSYGKNDVIFFRDKGQKWIVPTLFHEYWRRRVLIRAVTKMCINRTTLHQNTANFLRRIAQISEAMNVDLVARMAYSGIWNLRYYQGVADELGCQRHQFIALTHKHRQRPIITPTTAAAEANAPASV